MNREERGKLTDRLVSLAPTMDVDALLRILLSLGFERDRILLRSAHSSASPERLVAGLSFRSAAPPPIPEDQIPVEDPLADPQCLAVIHLNQGLLSAQTPLPSYLLALLSDPRINEPALRDYLAFVDHVLLDLLFSMADVDLGPRSSLGATGPAPLLAALSMDCPSCLHWLFTAIFPELSVTVKRASVQRGVVMDEFVIGESALGEAYAFCGASAVPTAGFEVRLSAEDWSTPAGEPWSAQARQRLDDGLLPILRTTDVALRVRLRFPGRGGAFKLAGRRGRTSRLGFDPFAHDEDQPIELILFDGSTLSQPQRRLGRETSSSSSTPTSPEKPGRTLAVTMNYDP